MVRELTLTGIQKLLKELKWHKSDSNVTPIWTVFIGGGSGLQFVDSRMTGKHGLSSQQCLGLDEKTVNRSLSLGFSGSTPTLSRVNPEFFWASIELGAGPRHSDPKWPQKWPKFDWRNLRSGVTGGKLLLTSLWGRSDFSNKKLENLLQQYFRRKFCPRSISPEIFLDRPPTVTLRQSLALSSRYWFLNQFLTTHRERWGRGQVFRRVCLFDVSRALGLARFLNRSWIARYNATMSERCTGHTNKSEREPLKVFRRFSRRPSWRKIILS